MALHSAQTAADGIHVLPRWEYVDTAARDAASYLAADVGGVARVGTAAPYTFWVLTNSTGPAWAQIGSGGSPTDEKVAVSSGDTTPGYLEQKLVAGAGITLTKLTPGGDEDLEVSLAGGSGFDIRDMVVFDHFVTGNLDADEIGSYGWRKDSTGTGSGLLCAPEVGHPGVIVIEGGTSDLGRSAVYLGETAAVNSWKLGTTQNTVEFEALIKFKNSVNSNDLERFTVGFGIDWDDIAGTEHSDGIYVELEPATASVFRLVSASSSTRTKQSGTTSPTVNTWYRIGIQITYPGGVPTAQLYVNGSAEGSPITTNIPTTGIGVGFRIDSKGGVSSPQAAVDYVNVTQVTAKED